MLSDAETLARATLSLRNMLRDKPLLNRLLLGNAESSDPELHQCILTALLDWNTSPPPLSYVTLQRHPNKMLLLQKAAAEAIAQAGLWHSREHLPSADGGTSADDHAKAAEYSGWADRLVMDYEKKRDAFKAALNISLALGTQGAPSEYGLMQNVIFGVTW